MPVKLSTSIEKQNKYVKKAKFCCKGDFCNFKFLPRDCSLKVDGSGLDLRNVDEVMGTSLLGERLSRDLSVKGNESSRLRSVLALQECDAALEQLHHQYEKVGRLCTEKNNHDKGSQLTHDVPYNIVLMARTEKDVINRFLRRYSQGLTDNVDVFGGAASRLIEKLPGHCYKAVQVCTQCYQVYGIIKDACRRCRKDGSIKSSGDHIQTPSITRDNGWLIGEDAISKNDISEVSSFANPPPAVRMTVDAVMLLLNGKTLSWNTCRSIMKNCDSFLSSLIYFEPSKLKKKIALEISRYVRNPYFCPKEIKSISLASSRLCAWVLSVYDRYKVKKGKHTNEFVHDLERKRAKEATLIGQGYDAVYKGSQESGNIERPEHGHFSDYDSSIRKALANRQKRKMNLLSDGRGRQDQQNNSARTLLCNDGVTRIPYKIIGDDTVQCEKISFIVCHDIFDTIDATKMMFMETVRAHRGCQVLLFNYPGQAWTTFPSSLLDANDDLQDKDRNSKIEQVLNNEFIAERLHELLSHVNRTGEFVTKIKPTHLVGIGSGLTVAIKFYDSYCKKDQQCVNIQSIVSINGIVEMEPQLTSILHASLSAFRSYPRDRPDLPVSFFAQFLFSENYFEKVPENLALSIHTAVMNPISLVGRIKLCSGFLKNVSLAKVLKNIEIPFIVLHGTESMLATDDHVKSLTRGRKCVYALMDEWKDNDLGLHNLRENEKDVLVLRVKSGHALWQENRQAVTRLIDHLSSPSEEFITLVQKNVEINLALSNDVETKRNARTQSNDRIDFQSHVERNQQLREISKSNKDIGSAPRVLAKKRLEMNANLDENIVNDDEKEKSVYSQNRQSVSKIVGELTPGSNFVTEGMPKIDYDSFRKDDDEEEEEGSVCNLQTTEIKDLSNDLPYTTSKNECSSRPEYKKNHFDYPFNHVGFDLDVNICNRSIHVKENLDSNDVAQIDKELSTLDEYLRIGLPIECIPSEHLTYSPTREQKELRSWKIQSNQTTSSALPSSESLLAAIELEHKNEQTREEFNIEKDKRNHEILKDEMHRFDADQKQRMEMIETLKEQALSRLDADRIKAIRLRAHEEMERRVELDQDEQQLLAKGVIPRYEPSQGNPTPLVNIAPTFYENPRKFGNGIKKKLLGSLLDDLEDERVSARNIKGLNADEFEQVKGRLTQQQIESREYFKQASEAERKNIHHQKAIDIQRVCRGGNGRKFFRAVAKRKRLDELTKNSAIVIQKVTRALFSRKFVEQIRNAITQRLVLDSSVSTVQRVWKGHCARQFANLLKRERAAIWIQIGVRSCIAKKMHAQLKHESWIRMNREKLSILLQRNWRRKVAVEEFRSHQIRTLASIEIQRVTRGGIGRKQAKIIHLWTRTAPGTDRLQLGLNMIQESKDEFERHRVEIDTLHRAQEKAEAKVTKIYEELKESEQDLHRLEEELREIDKVSIIDNFPGESMGDGTILGKEETSNDSITMSPTKCLEPGAVRYLNTASSRHRSSKERDHQRMQVETELSAALLDVQEKRRSLETIESTLVDMETTRLRKDREFARLQRNLMKVLDDQKNELEEIRTTGVELETAVSLSAEAANKTAAKAAEHQEQTSHMFCKHEDMLKFQFMSMSMTYFSSLKMLQEMREMNSETTAVAISNSAKSAAAAAAAASSAMSRSKSSSSNNKKTSDKLDEHLSPGAPERLLPDDSSAWTIDDVSYWLEKLSLSSYIDVFQEASIDGDFLMDLREEDLEEVLGIKHKLHRKKILLARQKLKSKLSRIWNDADTKGDESDHKTGNRDIAESVPLDVIFSQIRHGRSKRLQDSLKGNIDINSEDEYGNSLLMVAIQNRQAKIAKILLHRGAKVNHTNSNGNSALHFAFAYDTSGEIAQFLIENGADDSLVNVYGLSPYDGIGADELS